MVRNWAQNVSHAQAVPIDLRLNPLSGHEIVAKKRVQNPDRVFGEKVEVSVAFLYWDGRLAFLISPVRGKQSWGDWEIERKLLGLGDIPGKMKCGEQCWPRLACQARKHPSPQGVISTIASLSCASRIKHTQNCVMAATFAQ